MNSFLAPHCISVFVICKTLDGPRYLLIRRCGGYLPGTWQMVSGKIEEGETAPQAVLREIQEETGLVPATLYSADFVETFYMKSCDKITFVPVFAAFVESLDVVLAPQEHDAFEWLPLEEAKEKLAWSEQRRALVHVHETFIMKKPDELNRILIYN